MTEIDMVDFKNFLECIYKKTVKGKKYLYINVDSAFLKKPYYLGPEINEEDKLKEYYLLLKFKIAIDTIFHIFEENKKKLKCNYISDNDFLGLELCRFGYELFLKNFNKSDLEKYEDITYTKYVFGTTSIEGNTYTLRETELTLNEGLTVEGKTKREFYEIENYRKLNEYLNTKIYHEIDISLIKKIHSIILKDIDDEIAGEFRRINVGIRGTEFMPSPHIVIEEELQKLLDWYNQHKETVYPLELLTIFHQKFEQIHPFKDGNGRVGREIMRIMLKNNRFPSIFIGPTNRESYLKALDAGNSGDYKKIISFIVNTTLDVNKELVEKARQELTKISSEKLDDFDKSKKEVLKRAFKKINNIKFNRGYNTD